MTIQKITGNKVYCTNDENDGIVLDRAYCHKHAQLGYALTVAKSQGMTVNSADYFIDGITGSRKEMYVVMTRGRDMNMCYMSLNYEPGSEADTNINQRNQIGKKEINNILHISQQQKLIREITNDLAEENRTIEKIIRENVYFS